MKSRMTVGGTLALTSGTLIFLAASIGAVGLMGLNSVSRVMHSLTDDSLAGVSAYSKAEIDLEELRVELYRHVGFTDPAQKARLDGRIADLQQNIAKDLGAAEKAAPTDEERSLNLRIKPALDRYYAMWAEVGPLSRAGKSAEAFERLAAAKAIADGAIAAISAETEFNRESGLRNTADVEAATSEVRWTTGIVMVVFILGGTALAFFVIRHLNRRLWRVVMGLAESATRVAGASSQMSSGSQGLAQGSSEQAASLEETSASSEEINSMARRNSENSDSAAELMARSGKTFSRTAESLDGMVAAMVGITASSEKISKIIRVIDEIAFQTNILALNAAVEAARAGQAGMGFAVVAEEVRNLSQRCAQAAKDTAELIEESIARSHEGKAKVDQVSGEIQEVVRQSAEVQKLVEEVKAGSREQARGIDQMASAIIQMERVTQSTAATAEETAATARELSEQSESLMTIVDQLTELVGSGP